MMKTVVLLLAASLIYGVLYPQESTIKVVTAKGRCELVGSLSLDEAKLRAVSMAKKEALVKAGVTEHIRAYDMLSKSEIGNSYDEVFMSDIQSDIRGGVRSYTDSISNGIENGIPYVEATLKAEVIIYPHGADHNFQVKIEGIKQGYQQGESMTYSVVPSMDCYLNIFNMFNKNATLIFPNPYEQPILLKAETKQVFPFSELIDGYYMEKLGKEPELNKLLFVFTKNRIPFIDYKTSSNGDQTAEYKDILRWFYNIPPDQRANVYQQCVIY